MGGSGTGQDRTGRDDRTQAGSVGPGGLSGRLTMRMRMRNEAEEGKREGHGLGRGLARRESVVSA
jgi:hypothetical protein